MTYGDVALVAGRPGAARAVGTAMRLNPDIPATPCHRVVPASGRVGAYSGPNGTARKRQLLRGEGVKLKGDTIVSFERLRWRPASRVGRARAS